MTSIINILKNSNHSDIFKKAGETGSSMDTPVYLVGGYIRDVIYAL